MDADPERVHHSLLAQVQHYANCNLFPGQEARSTILHCMQSRLFSVAGSFPVSAWPVWGPQQLSSAREQNVETADSGWKLMLLSLDFLISPGMFKVAAGNDTLTTWDPARWESSSAQMWCSESAAEPETRNVVGLGCLRWMCWYFMLESPLQKIRKPWN